MILALSCGVCEYLLLSYSTPGLPVYLLVLAALIFAGSVASIVTSSLTLRLKGFRLLYLVLAVLVGFAMYGAATFVGAFLALVLFSGYLNLRLLGPSPSRASRSAIWVTVAVLAVAAIPYCLRYNREQLARQPERLTELVIRGGITAKRAEKDLEDLPPSALREMLAGRLEVALAQESEKALVTYQKRHIVNVLVAWHDHRAIPAIRKAAESGQLPKELAEDAISELEKQKSA